MAHRDKFGRTTFERKWTRQEDSGKGAALPEVTFPLKISRSNESFSIEDAAGRGVCSIYFEDEEARRQQMRRLTEAEARQIAQTITRMLTDAGNAVERSGETTIPLENLNAQNDE